MADRDVPHLSCIVQYQDAVVPLEALEAARAIPPRPTPSPSQQRRRNGAPDPCEGLNGSERTLFNHLREWRAKLARGSGIPPYVILTNKQLVAIVRRRPDSPTASKAAVRRLNSLGEDLAKASMTIPSPVAVLPWIRPASAQ